jgi:hypothetical protein
MKITIMLALVALMVTVFALPALAAVITGNDRGNTLFETSGDDTMKGRGGNDVLDANNFSLDVDVANGNRGADRVLVNDEDSEDTANGGRGKRDICVVTDRTEVGGGCEIVRVNPLDTPDTP